MLDGTGPLFCVLSALCLTVPAAAWDGEALSPVQAYLNERDAAAGLTPRYSIPPIDHPYAHVRAQSGRTMDQCR